MKSLVTCVLHLDDLRGEVEPGHEVLDAGGDVDGLPRPVDDVDDVVHGDGDAAGAHPAPRQPALVVLQELDGGSDTRGRQPTRALRPGPGGANLRLGLHNTHASMDRTFGFRS